jgi:hypothetical protein
MTLLLPLNLLFLLFPLFTPAAIRHSRVLPILKHESYHVDIVTIPLPEDVQTLLIFLFKSDCMHSNNMQTQHTI